MTAGGAVWRARAALALAAAAAVAWAGRAALTREGGILAALSAEEVAAACARSGASPQEFWERAAAMGIGGALLKEETLADLEARGELLRFSRGEIEKGRLMGLLSPGSPLKPGSLLARDAALLERLTGGTGASRVLLATAAYAGYYFLEPPPGADWSRLPAGVDPEALRQAAAAGLTPIAAGLGQVRSIPSASGLADWLRTAHGGCGRVLHLRLSQDLDAEGNLDLLREGLRALKARGERLLAPGPNLDPGGRPVAPAPPERRRPRLPWAAAALILGPLLSMRAGLRTLRFSGPAVAARWPQASPVLELAAAVAAVTAAAAAIGLCAGAVGGLPVGRVLRVALPLLAGAAALFAPELGQWRQWSPRPLTFGAGLKLAVLSAAALLLLDTRTVLEGLGASAAAAGWADAWPAFWWWPWRWRELLIGYPCLVYGLFRLKRRWDCPECDAAAEAGAAHKEPGRKADDPRLWLVPALLAPAGALAAAAEPCATAGAILGQIAWTASAGAVLGVFAVVGAAWLSRTLGPLNK